jgi:hypothetical protein
MEPGKGLISIQTPRPEAGAYEAKKLDRIYRMDMIFAPFPDGREQPASAEGGAGCFVPASGREKNIQSILLILSRGR